MSRKVLVVIDMQKDFLEPDGKLSLGKDTTEFKARVANYIKEFDGDVIATLDTHKDDAAEFNQFPPHCLYGTEGWELSNEILEAILEVKADKIQKESFAGEDVTRELLSYLEEGCEFEFVGVCTSICVIDGIVALYHAAKEKLNKIPTITVQKSLVDDFDVEMSEGALKRMERLYNVKVV